MSLKETLEAVYNLCGGDSSGVTTTLSERVKEALGVIESVLDEHG